MSAQHLLVFAERETAAEVARALTAMAGYGGIEVVREALAGEDDSEDHDWAVYCRTPELEPYRTHLRSIASAVDGWYDEHAFD